MTDDLREVSDLQRQRRGNFGELVADHGTKNKEELDAETVHVRAAGRILAIRSFGKANFLVLSDGQAKIQAYIRQDAMPAQDFATFKLLDLGDYVGVEGKL